MRRILALGCCAIYLAFGFVAGVAHVHESADHHEESRGLHFDHAHLGEPGQHDAHHEFPGTPTAIVASPHVDHHAGDALYLLIAPATRAGDSASRPMPAIVHPDDVVEPVSSSSSLDAAVSGPPHDASRKIPPRLRAPPA